MKILQVHNYYQQPGGEDSVVAAEKLLLENNGHEVITYRRHNDDIKSIGAFRLALLTHWNSQTVQEICHLIDLHHPHIVHCHNIFPLISPSIYIACNRRKIPVVQTLHNYRMFCANGYLLYNDNVCEYCLRHPFSPMPAFWRCYRNSFSATTVQLTLRWTNRLLQTYSKHIDAIIVLTQFAQRMLGTSEILENKVYVKPNFIADPLSNVNSKSSFISNIYKIPVNLPYFLFAGRLSREKGIFLLIEAWKIADPQASLIIVGDGPLASEVQMLSRNSNRIIYPGRVSATSVAALMQNALAVVVPSICYECMPTAIIESFGNGTPVITGNHGAMAEMVINSVNGIHFESGNKAALAKQLTWSVNNTKALNIMGDNARISYLTYYAPAENYKMFMHIFNYVCNHENLNHDCKHSLNSH